VIAELSFFAKSTGFLKRVSISKFYAEIVDANPSHPLLPAVVP
jgi:hypothetical protein